MSDLISRERAIFFVSDVLDRFGVNVGDKMANSLIKQLEVLPTAFDLESVIEQLKELKTYKLDMADTMLELMKRDKLGTYVCLEDVIEIIESAANATNGKNGG